MRRSLAIAGATVVCGGAVAFGATAYATSEHPASTAGTGTLAEAVSTPRTFTFTIPDLGKLNVLEHGETTVQDPTTGKTSEQDVQQGKVTARTDSSITVKSDDGTSWTWTLTKNTTVWNDDKTTSSVKVGDSVIVQGTHDGDTRTAERIGDPPPDLSKIQHNLDRLGQRLQEELPKLPS